MSEYNRLTERGEPYYAFDKCKTCEYGKDGCDKWCDQTVGCFCRLQELEYKIDNGTLVELPCKSIEELDVIRKGMIYIFYKICLEQNFRKWVFLKYKSKINEWFKNYRRNRNESQNIHNR